MNIKKVRESKFFPEDYNKAKKIIPLNKKPSNVLF